MKINQTLVLQFVAESEKPILLPNIYANVAFFINGRHCYSFRFGPSDDQGWHRITYENVETKRLLAAKSNLMDYNTGLENCDARVKIDVPTGNELKEAYEWQAKWFSETTSQDAKGWLEAANARISAEPVMIELAGPETLAIVHCKLRGQRV